MIFLEASFLAISSIALRSWRKSFLRITCMNLIWIFKSAGTRYKSSCIFAILGPALCAKNYSSLERQQSALAKLDWARIARVSAKGRERAPQIGTLSKGVSVSMLRNQSLKPWLYTWLVDIAFLCYALGRRDTQLCLLCLLLVSGGFYAKLMNFDFWGSRPLENVYLHRAKHYLLGHRINIYTLFQSPILCPSLAYFWNVH